MHNLRISLINSLTKFIKIQFNGNFFDIWSDGWSAVYFGEQFDVLTESQFDGIWLDDVQYNVQLEGIQYDYGTMSSLVACRLMKSCLMSNDMKHNRLMSKSHMCRIQVP